MKLSQLFSIVPTERAVLAEIIGNIRRHNMRRKSSFYFPIVPKELTDRAEEIDRESERLQSNYALEKPASNAVDQRTDLGYQQH